LADDTPKRSVSRAAAAAMLALVPAYFSISGLLTGETLALERRTHSYSGNAAMVTSIAYGLFATAMMIAASTYLAADSKRRKALVKWGWRVTTMAAVLFFAGRFMWLAR
jgi:hypothetical protein